MPRPSRRKIKFDESSVNDLLQEIYNDTHIIRSRIVSLFTKWEAKVKENGEVAAIGQEIIKLIAEESKTQDRKIALLKILKDVVFNNKNNDSGNNEEENSVSEERRNELIDMVANATRKKR
jgi:hypothetical protein